MKKVMIAVAAMVAVSACASTTAPMTQMVEVTSAPAGAKCWVKNENTKASVAKTPGSVEVTHSSHHTDDLTVACKKDGKKGSAAVKHSGDSAYPSPVHIVVQ